jgi:hypothetical protein
LTSASPASSFLDLADDATSYHRNFRLNTALARFPFVAEYKVFKKNKRFDTFPQKHLSILAKTTYLRAKARITGFNKALLFLKRARVEAVRAQLLPAKPPREHHKALLAFPRLRTRKST